MGWMSRLFRAKRVAPSAPVVAPDVVSEEQWLQTRYRDELAKGVELTRRMRQMELLRREQVFVTNWCADSGETHRRVLDARLKGQGVVEGTKDPVWDSRFRGHMSAVGADEAWPERRAKLCEEGRRQFQRVTHA